MGFMSESSRDLSEIVPRKDRTADAGSRSELLLSGLFLGPTLGLIGIVCLLQGIAGLAYGLHVRSLWAIGWAMFFGLLGGLCLFPFCLIMYVLIDSSRCKTIDELAVRLGVTEDEIRKSAAEKGVVARYHVDHRVVYRLGDFESLVLLRASSPDPPDMLLRAPTTTSGTDDNLLRVQPQLDMTSRTKLSEPAVNDTNA